MPTSTGKFLRYRPTSGNKNKSNNSCSNTRAGKYVGELRWAWHGGALSGRWAVGGVGVHTHVSVSSALNVAIYAPKTMLRQPHE